MTMKLHVFLAVATLAPGMFLMQAGGSSVAVIDFERAVSETPAGKEALTKLRSFGTEQQAALEKKQKEAADLESRLRVQGRALTEEARAQLSHDLETTLTTIQQMGDEAQKKITQMQQELLAPVSQRTAMAVSAYAAEHSLKIVLDASALQNGLVYVHDTADITSEIIRRIAHDLQAPGQLDASLSPRQDKKTLSERLNQRLLARTWLDAKRLTNTQFVASLDQSSGSK